MSTQPAFLFDLDGVIVDTAKYHFWAWKRLAEGLGIGFDEEQNEQLKGVSRVESLNRILKWGDKTLCPDEFAEALDRKNRDYLSYVEQMQPDEILPGVSEFLSQCRALGIPVALGSASKNAPLILDRLGLRAQFDAVVDGNSTQRSKPDPEVFLLGARALGVAPDRCVVFEDAQAGIEAAHRAGMKAVGVGHASELSEAEVRIPGFLDLLPTALLERLS
ncbi:beta-phosphoglucomutase [bacterium]|nr:beta-phosphoglucomutase [bacterium]